MSDEITDSVHPIARNIMKELQDAEKRIAALEEELDDVQPVIDQAMREMRLFAARAKKAEAELAEAKRWRRTADEQPVDGQICIVSDGMSFCSFGIRRFDYDIRESFWSDGEVWGYWKPLPDAPEEK